MTAKQYNKLHPEKYILSGKKDGKPIYIAPLVNGDISTTTERTQAEKWTAIDVTPIKAKFHSKATGVTMQFEQL